MAARQLPLRLPGEAPAGQVSKRFARRLVKADAYGPMSKCVGYQNEAGVAPSRLSLPPLRE